MELYRERNAILTGLVILGFFSFLLRESERVTVEREMEL